MKKFIVMALCVLLLLIAAVPTLAANETVIKVTADKTELQRGETVNFTVSISGDTPFTSVMVGLNFDSNVFEYVAPATPPSTVGSFMVVPYDGTATEVGLFGMTPATYNGVIQVITFKVKSNAPLKAVKITGEGASGSNADGSITVKFTGTEVAIGCKHQYPDKNAWSKIDGTSHRRVCTKCQTPEVEPHNWDDGTVKKDRPRLT